MRRVRLFVYGSLKRGFAHHGEMRGARFECETSTAPGYALFSRGAYPAMVAMGADRVFGELYRVGPAHLLALDRFEGCPSQYQRVEIALADDESAAAYVITAPRSADAVRLADGVWLER